MLRIEIQYISLIAAREAPARIIFPAHAHGLKVLKNGTLLPHGEQIRIVAKDANGTEMDLGAPANPTVGGRVFSIKSVTGTTVAAKDDAALLGSGNPAQAILRIGGGRFEPQVARDAQGYEDAVWKFVPGGRTQELTDTVTWVPTRQDLKYFFRSGRPGDTDLLLTSTDVLTFTNKDHASDPVVADPDGMVRIREASSLYDLVTPTPASRPIPETRYRRPPPESLLVRLAQSLGTFLLRRRRVPDRPLCPVGEP